MAEKSPINILEKRFKDTEIKFDYYADVDQQHNIRFKCRVTVGKGSSTRQNSTPTGSI